MFYGRSCSRNVVSLETLFSAKAPKGRGEIKREKRDLRGAMEKIESEGACSSAFLICLNFFSP